MHNHAGNKPGHRTGYAFAKAGISFIYEGETRGSGVLLSKELSRRIGESPEAIAKSKIKKRKAK